MMRNGCLTLCQFSIPNDVVRILKYYQLTYTYNKCDENLHFKYLITAI